MNELETKKKLKKWMIIPVILIIVTLLTIFLVIPKVRSNRQSIFDSGINYGMEYAVKTIMEEVGKCQQPLPLTYGDNTLQITAMECLQ